MNKSSVINYAQDKGAKPAGGERPAIVRMDSGPTKDVSIERATGSGTTVPGTVPLINADNNRTQTLKP